MEGLEWRWKKEEKPVICHSKRSFSQYYLPQSVISCSHISPFSAVFLFFLNIPSTHSHAPFFSISTSVHGTKHVCSLLLLQSLIVLVHFGVKHPDVTPSYLAEIQARETLWISKRIFPLPRTLVESAVCWNNDHTNYEWVNHNLLLTKFQKLWLDRSMILFKVYNYLPCLKRSSRILIICEKFYFIQVYCSRKLL